MMPNSTGNRTVELLKPSEEKAVIYLSRKCFHQTFRLPSYPEIGRSESFLVSYSDVDYRESGNDGPTVFFIGGMYGGRYLACGVQEALARKHHLRLIVVDKFGQGATPNVLLGHRVKGFLDILSALVDHLNIKHIALISHSAGSIYQFNTILQFRDKLHPKNPYACFLSPWVHQSHTNSLKALSLVPDSIIGRSDRLIKFINHNITPAITWSSGIVSTSTAIHTLDSKSTKPSTGNLELSQTHNDANEYSSYDKADPILAKLTMRYMFAENTSGAPDEALLCLKRGENPSWGFIDDHDDAIDKIINNEHERTVNLTIEANHEEIEQQNKLRIQVYFPESDHLIGEKGKQWMDRLWRQKCESSEAFIYQGETIKGTNHDTIVEQEFGVVDKIFQHIKSSWT